MERKPHSHTTLYEQAIGDSGKEKLLWQNQALGGTASWG